MWPVVIRLMRMRAKTFLGIAVTAIAFFGSLHAFQRSFREYPGIEYNTFPLPADWEQKTEWTFARLMYPPYSGGLDIGFGGYGRFRGDWTRGLSIWTQDYPRADRHFLLALRRLSRINARSVEQPVNLDDDDDVYNWPWLYAVQVGQWQLTDRQADKLRDYLLRGGFFMADDFWGSTQWQVFEESMRRVFPERAAVDLDDSSPIFHSVYDLDDRYQVPGARYLYTGVTEKCDDCPPYWRGVYDDKGRIVVALTVDSDLGDSWEWADNPRYQERYSALGIRIGVNYIMYAMTH